jgi:flagellar hook protein FlgE
MIDSMFVALSGMFGHERALSVISNNVSNMNTAGFRRSTLDFSDVFTHSPNTRLPDGRFVGQQGTGEGVKARSTLLDLRPGELDRSGRGLDLMLQGAGYFVLQDEHGAVSYTRDGSFEFDADGVLVVRGESTRVMSRNAAGELVPLTLANLTTSAPKATANVVMTGTLVAPTDDANNPVSVEPVTVFDAKGVKHALKLSFARSTVSAGNLIEWTMTVLEGDQELGTGSLQFIANFPAFTDPLRVTLALAGSDPLEVAFDFSGVTGQPNGQPLAVQSQDGFGRGTVSAETFDAQGVLQLSYSNGQKASGPKLVLAQIADEDGLAQANGSRLEYRGAHPVALREAGDDLKVVAQALERSNVDLSLEFTQLILMQRGYQAS